MAAKQGYADAQNSLGSMYLKGEGVSRDDGLALHWFRLAAEQGHAVGQYNLGGMYDEGYGVATDDTEAVRWYLLAGEQGQDMAQNNLGSMYQKGRGRSAGRRQGCALVSACCRAGNCNESVQSRLFVFGGTGRTEK